MLLRRLRGLAISSLLWSIPWAGFGTLVGIAYELGLFPEGWVIMGPASAPVVLGFAGAVIGGINGALFGGLLMLAERRRGIGELRLGRVGAWAALASGGTMLALSGSLGAAAVCAVVGFGAGAGALRLAQRGELADRVAPSGPAGHLTAEV